MLFWERVGIERLVILHDDWVILLILIGTLHQAAPGSFAAPLPLLQTDHSRWSLGTDCGCERPSLTTPGLPAVGKRLKHGNGMGHEKWIGRYSNPSRSINVEESMSFTCLKCSNKVFLKNWVAQSCGATLFKIQDNSQGRSSSWPSLSLARRTFGSKDLTVTREWKHSFGQSWMQTWGKLDKLQVQWHKVLPYPRTRRNERAIVTCCNSHAMIKIKTNYDKNIETWIMSKHRYTQTNWFTTNLHLKFSCRFRLNVGPLWTIEKEGIWENGEVEFAYGKGEQQSGFIMKIKFFFDLLPDVNGRKWHQLPVPNSTQLWWCQWHDPALQGREEVKVSASKRAWQEKFMADVLVTSSEHLENTLDI